MKTRSQLHPVGLLAIVCGFFIFASNARPQAPAAAVEQGSRTAKQGFKNEDEIRDKFNNWRSDIDAKAWLKTMGHDYHHNKIGRYSKLVRSCQVFPKPFQDETRRNGCADKGKQEIRFIQVQLRKRSDKSEVREEESRDAGKQEMAFS